MQAVGGEGAVHWASSHINTQLRMELHKAHWHTAYLASTKLCSAGDRPKLLWVTRKVSVVKFFPRWNTAISSEIVVKSPGGFVL